MTITPPAAQPQAATPGQAVDYSPRLGATCPACGTIRAAIVGTRPWFGAGPWHRQRFHRCANCGLAFQSIETTHI